MEGLMVNFENPPSHNLLIYKWFFLGMEGMDGMAGFLPKIARKKVAESLMLMDCGRFRQSTNFFPELKKNPPYPPLYSINPP